jgi:hypothetical protein
MCDIQPQKKKHMDRTFVSLTVATTANSLPSRFAFSRIARKAKMSRRSKKE